MDMVSHTAARHRSITTPTYAVRPPRRNQTLARGPGWQLGEGEAGSWVIRLDRDGDEPCATWTDMLQAIRNIAELTDLRPLLIDLRGAARLSGSTAELAAALFGELERRSLRVCAVVGPDLVHAARLHRLFGLHAPLHGRCFLTEDEGLDWVTRGTWPLDSTPVVARPWTRSRPYLSVTSPPAQP